MSSALAKSKRIARDNYPTPIKVIRTLVSELVLRPTDTFLEPCLAGGNIYYSIPLPEVQKSWAEIRLGVDYLKTSFAKHDVIGTNIPFSLSEEFIRKMLSELKPDGTLFFLQRMDFLGSLKRVPLWEDVGLPNKTPVIVPRPSFTGGGTDSGEYCWYIYDRGNRFPKMKSGLSHLVTREL